MVQGFGVPSEALCKFRDLKITYDSRTQGRKAIISRLRLLRQVYPHSSAMLHAFAPLWKRNSEFNVTPLPQHYLDNQIAAIRGRFELGPNDPIPDCAIYLLICRVCENVYSLYNEYGEGKSCMNPRTCDGYRWGTA